MEAIIVVLTIFSSIFGIFYLHFSTRNKERLALIEKGAEASIFVKGKTENVPPIWKILILNFSLLLIGIGLAIFIANIMVYTFGLNDEIAFPGTIFLMAGIGLLTGFFVSRKLFAKN